MTEPEQIRQTGQHGWGAYLTALLLVAGVSFAGYYGVRTLDESPCLSCADEPQDAPPESPMPPQGPVGYEKWPRPDLALVLSGQMHGYTDPCGCSEPQYGGLQRRYNFIHSLQAKKWNVVGIDLGEIAAPSNEGITGQRLLKFDLSIKALAAMNYRAFGIGKHEIANGLGEGLAQIYDDKRPFPRPLCLTLDLAGKGNVFHDLNVRPYEIIKDVSPKVGVLSIIGPDLRDELKQMKWRDDPAGARALQAFADAGVEVGIILHHEYPKINPDNLGGQLPAQAVAKARLERARECAKFCADLRKKNPKIPPIPLMMILGDDDASTFLIPLDPKLETNAVEIGCKGTYVGLVGLYRDKGHVKVEYQAVKMSPEWKNVDGKERENPVTRLYEQYHQHLKNVNMLAQSPRTPHFNQLVGENQKGLKATFVGSERCAKCHQSAFDKWNNKTRHSEATDVLEDLTRIPVGRQYDPECMKCHTTGFKHPGGYNDVIANLAAWNGQSDPKVNPKQLQAHNSALRGVGCESCHGPCSEHVRNPKDAEWLNLINPYRPSAQERAAEEAVKKNPGNQAAATVFAKLNEPRMRALNSFCVQCHDPENDVNWFKSGVTGHWQRIVHRTPTK